MKNLTISKDLALPSEVITLATAILAQRGKGKSYLSDVMAEEMLDLHQQVVILDPTGAHFGLKSSADGKSPGYPIVIFGGDHADVPLEERSGAILAKAIVENGFSAIIDLTTLRKGARHVLVADFLEELYRINRNALHLFLDEAHTIAPQRVAPDTARMLGAAEDCVMLGRRRGLGCTLITQRPQALNKNVLTQCEVLVAMGMSHHLDIGAVEEWAAAHATVEQLSAMKKSLASLGKGEAWFWSPSLDIFKKVQVRKRRTFDSGATPKPGEKKIVPKHMAKVDIEKLGAEIKATAESAKSNDPAELKRKIRELENKIVAEQKKVVVAEPQKNYDKLLRQAQDAGIRIGFSQSHDAALKFREEAMKYVTDIDIDLQAIKDFLKLKAPLFTMKPKLTDSDGVTLPDLAPGKIQSVVKMYLTPSDEKISHALDIKKFSTVSAIGGAMRKVLIALAQVYPERLDRSTLGARLGIKAGGTSLTTYISRLRTQGLIEGSSDLLITNAGCCYLGNDYEQLPQPGEPLFLYWLDKIGASNAMGKVMSALFKEQTG
jgi:hypothetical protein